MTTRERFAGQEGSLYLLNSTTGDPLCEDINIESFNWDPLFELTKKQFIGEIGPDFREFSDGFSLGMKCEINDASQTVALYNLLIARAQGAILDELSAGLIYRSPDAGSFKITCVKLRVEKAPLDLGSRTDFATIDLAFKHKVCKIQLI